MCPDPSNCLCSCSCASHCQGGGTRHPSCLGWEGVLHIRFLWCSVRLERMQSSICLWYDSVAETYVRPLSRHLKCHCIPCSNCALARHISAADVFTLPHIHIDQSKCRCTADKANVVTHITIPAARLCDAICSASDLVQRVQYFLVLVT